MKIFISAENLCGFIFFIWLCFLAVAFVVGCIWPDKKGKQQDKNEDVNRVIDSLDGDFDV